MQTLVLLTTAACVFLFGSSQTLRSIRDPERRPAHAQLFFNSELASRDPPATRIYGGLAKLSKTSIRQLDDERIRDYRSIR